MTLSIEDQITEMEKNNSLFEYQTRRMELDVAAAFKKSGKIHAATFKETPIRIQSKNPEAIQTQLPNIAGTLASGVLEAIPSSKSVEGKRVAVLFSGGPAAGGHNVVLGVKEALGSKNTLLGVKSGPKGLLNGDLFEITDEAIAKVKNLGGFDFLGSDRTKIKTPEQFEQVRQTVRQHKLDGIIVVGGDDSNTNAAFLADFLAPEHCQVIGVPKTIDGDLQVGTLLPITFGFDTATKIYAELVGNILQDTPSSRKYWHFVKLMGRSASHVALEVALQTKPAITLISEEIETEKIPLNDIIDCIAGKISYRAGKGINHGVVVVPEGLIEFIPDLKVLINELNEILASYDQDVASLEMAKKRDFVSAKLSANSAKIMAELPDEIEAMLLLERDSHGNLQVSKIPTEVLLIQMTELKLMEMKNHPDKFFAPDKINLNREEIERFKKFKFSTNNHFFGYEGRCGAPSRFDAVYCFNLGLIAGSLILDGKTGFMAVLSNLYQGGKPMAIPLLSLLQIERRHGQDELVIEKALVKLDSPAFQYFKKRRDEWSKQDLFSSPGPRQLVGPVANQLPFTVVLNQGYPELTYQIG